MEASNQECWSLNCQNPRGYYCKDHRETLCHKCCDAFHFQCNFQIIPKADEVTEAIELLTQLVKGLCQEAKKYGLLAKIKGLQGSLDTIAQVVQKLEETATTAVKNDEFLKYAEIKLEARYIKRDILNSKYGQCENGPNNIFELLFYSKMFDLTKPNGKKKYAESVEESHPISQNILETQGETTKPLIFSFGKEEYKSESKDNDNKCSDFEETDEKEESKDYQNQTKEQQIIKELLEKIQVLEENSLKDEVIKKDQLKDLEEMKINLEAVCSENTKLKHNIIELHHVIKKNEKPLREMRQANCEELYNDIYNDEVKFDSSTELALDFFDLTSRKFIKQCNKNRIELPEIKGLSLYNISKDFLKILDDFLSNSIVEELSIFRLEKRDKQRNEPKIVNGLSKALPHVTSEIFLKDFTFCKNSFKIIMDRTNQVFRLIFNACTIDISEETEIDIEYSNMNYLSFVRSNIQYVDSHRVSELLIEIIGKSPIQSSLRTLNIYQAGLDKSKVQKALLNKGMFDIVIINNRGDIVQED
ncbi:unnamed protein product [Moneuplotes crassus]|uniref:Uncharacterized protein n=1 Tax=Euplotes crassus TaxID=5936 RepID=A0AAD1Y453_EUPCR|nr:unnamed protein product [Moneuplotes crassus]